jgi:spore photoproduct lyase
LSNLLNHRFSHIYVEEKVKEHPITKKIISKFEKSKIIYINDYKEIFSGFDQNFSIQKESQKLILAEKKDHFIYKGSKMCHDFDNSAFFYTNNIINCLYDCKYCYLGGMYPSSNIVVFVNIKDFFNEMEKLSKKYDSIYLSYGYDTDIPLFENIYPFIQAWNRKIIELGNINMEIRTKSNILHNILTKDNIENIIPAWTLNPQKFVEKYEKKTPSLDERLKSIKQVQKMGVKVRISIDPIIIEENYLEEYKDLVYNIFNSLNPYFIRDISLGVFRIPNIYLKNLKKHSNSPIVFSDFEVKNSIATYPLRKKEYTVNNMIRLLSDFIDREKIFII